jgi:signal transduction histidine kinase
MTAAELQFMVDASRTLALAARRFDDTLEAVAENAVPRLGDWCFVDLVDDSGALGRRAIAGPGLGYPVLPIAAREEFGDTADALPREAIACGRTLVFERPDDAIVSRLAPSDHSAAALRARNLTSVVIVPLAAERICGALSLCSADPARHEPARIIEVAEEYARHASLALASASRLHNARRASRMKDEFLSTVSHELRTPLNAMLGWLWMIRHHQLDPARLNDALDSVDRSAQTTAKLLDDLLDLSRVVAGRLALARESLDLRDVVRETVEAVHAAAEKRGVELTLRAHASALSISGDRARLQQVFANLLSNAVRFTPAGGRVDVEVSGTDAQATVVVRDTGIGIAAHALPTVFDRFRRADHSAPRGGRGLGLAIAQQLERLHGGRIAAASAGVGRGATFTVTLPCAPAQPRAARPAPISADIPLSGLGGTRILLVDDDADNLELLAFALRSAGAAVTDVDSVEKAIAAFHAGNIDVVVTDIAMPDRDGFTLLEEIRHMASSARVPVVAVSAHAQAEDRERGSTAGFAAYMSKPISPELLVRTVTDILTPGADR